MTARLGPGGVVLGQVEMALARMGKLVLGVATMCSEVWRRLSAMAKSIVRSRAVDTPSPVGGRVGLRGVDIRGGRPRGVVSARFQKER